MAKTRLTLLLFLITSIFCWRARAQQTFTIPDGNVNALIAAMEQANLTELVDTIFLAEDGLYVLNRPYLSSHINAGFNTGPVGLPPIAESTHLVIRGRGARIRRSDGAPLFRLLTSDAGSRTELYDITFENGATNVNGGGAAFFNFRSTVLIDGCEFIQNEALVRYGGAIFIGIFCEVEIKNTAFIGNKATRLGGAIYNVLANLSLENCLLRQNVISSPLSRDVSGGAIYADGGRTDNFPTQGHLIMRNCVVEENLAGIGTDPIRGQRVEGISGGGGGVQLFGYLNNIIIVENCTFQNNKCAGFGAGLYCGSNPSPVDGPTGPNTVRTTISGCLFNSNSTEKLGGGLWIDAVERTGDNPIASVENCTFYNNSSNEYGGAMYIFQPDVDIRFCTIAQNFARLGGGGIQSPNLNLNVNNTIFYNNRVGGRGNNSVSCRRSYSGSNNIQFPPPLPNGINDFRCTPNTMIFADPMLGPLQFNGGPTQTMALLPGSPALDVIPPCGGTTRDQRGLLRGSAGANAGTNCDIGAYEFDADGFTVNVPTNLVAQNATTSTIDLTWDDNSDNENGFVIERSIHTPFNFEEIATVGTDATTYQDVGLTSKTTYYYRVKAEGGENEEFSNPAGATTFTDGACGIASTDYAPVIIATPDAILGDGTPESCTEDALRNVLAGGGNIICDCGTDSLTVTITQELKVEKNTVFDGGSVLTLDAQNNSRIFNVDEGIDFTLQHIRLINGQAPAGGDLFAESGGAILLGSGITGNGGGELSVIDVVFENNTITQINTAERGGGAIYGYRLRNLIVSECEFRGNTANVGGAIASIGSQVIIVNSDFSENEAAGPEGFLSGTGGAVYLDGIDLWDQANTQDHRLEICGASFRANQAKHEGGALYTVVSDSRRNQVLIDRSTFERNQLISTQNGNGGAIFHVEDDYNNNTNDPAQNLIIRNSTFNANSAQKQGGAVWTITGGGALIENCTFEGNRVLRPNASLGGALAISSADYGGDFTLNHITFANNQSAHFGGALFGATNNNVVVNNSIFSNNTSDFEFEGHQLAGPANFTGGANILFPPTRWNGSLDSFAPDTVSVQDPALSPLAANGGPTLTMALADTSAAVDNPEAINPSTTDQRGLAVVNTRDLGAYEFGAILTDAPVITEFDPVIAPLRSTITIRGLGFLGTSQITFNGASATDFTVIDDQTLSVVVPDFATTGPISVTTPRGTGISTDDFTVDIPTPSISSFTPAAGNAGDTITIIGQDLIGLLEVNFAEAPLAGFVIVNDTTIKVAVPETAIDGPIQVVTGGGNAFSAEDFRVLPSISSFEPEIGGRDVEVIILGTNIGNADQVLFGGTAIGTNLTLESNILIRATVPNTAPFGTAPIRVVIGNDTIASPEDFTIIPPPTLTDFNPKIDTARSTLTITGTNLTETTSIEFFDEAATPNFTVIDDNTIEVLVPEGAIDGIIKVITPGGEASSTDIFQVIPRLYNFFPAKAGTGTAVTILGSNLVGVNAPVDVDFGTAVSQAPFQFQGSDRIRATVGAGATGVITARTDTNGIAVTEEIFTYIPPPNITGFTPNNGPVGTEIKIYGEDLGELIGVEIGGVQQFDFYVSTLGTLDTVYATVSPEAITGLITLNTLGGTDNTAGSFVVEPTLYSFSPALGGAGTQISIQGANLTNMTSVEIPGIPIASAVAVSATQINAIVDAGPTTEVSGNITVTNNNNNPAESVTSAGVFTFIPPPTIDDFTLKEDTLGATITITGTNFRLDDTQVRFNDIPATISSFTATELQVIVPSELASGEITVTTTGGTATGPEPFRVMPFPPLTIDFTPKAGEIGTPVLITGDNFTQVSSVQFFDGKEADFTVNADNSLTVIVPDSAEDGPITIFVPGTDSAVTAQPFDVLPYMEPVITSFDPINGEVGSEVIITGNNFTSVSDVQFNGVSATYRVVNSRRIVATVPDATTGFIALTKPMTPTMAEPNPDDFLVSSDPNRFNVTFIWTGLGATDAWSDPNNWSPTDVPNDLEASVIIPNNLAGFKTPRIQNTESFAINRIVLEQSTVLIVEEGGELVLSGLLEQFSDNSSDIRGALRLAGTDEQPVPGLLRSVGSLIIDNPLGASMRGNVPLIITNTLEMVQGNLKLNGRVLDLGETGTIIGERPVSRILGETGSILATRTLAGGSTNIVADLAAGINIANLGAEITIGNTTDLTGIQVRRGHTRQGDVNEGIKRYYVINPQGRTDDLNATLVFNYFDAEVTETGLNENNLILFRFDGTAWRPQRSSLVDPAANTLFQSNIPRFSTWSAGEVDLPLPVSLTTFTGTRLNEDQVALHWQTSREAGILSYEIQKSLDLNDFSTIGSVDGAGHSEEVNDYQFIDYQAPESSYYRLLQVNAQGSSPMGTVVFVPAEGQAQPGVALYPNPIRSEETILLELGQLSDPDQELHLQLTNSQGNIVLDIEGNLQTVNKGINLRLQNLANGVYLIRLQDGLTIYQSKLVKH